MKFKWIILSFSLLLILKNATGQDYGNGWINYSQEYFKISVTEDGLYKISQSELEDAGFPVGSVDPRYIQLIHRGVEQSIHIEGQGDGSFDDNDYIEFYGKRNDGTLDEELYVSPNAHKRKYHNFYSDTSAYFLTRSFTQQGKRIASFKENNIDDLLPEPYYINDQLKLFTNNYSRGLHYPIDSPSVFTLLSAFDYGEGWTGGAIARGGYTDIQFSNLGNVVTSGPQPILEVLLTGRNSRPHAVDISVGSNTSALRSLSRINFKNYYDTLVINSIEWADISEGNLTCRIAVPEVFETADFSSISSARLTYAANFDHAMADQKVYNIPANNQDKSYVEFQNVPSGAKLIDISDPGNLVDVGFNTAGNNINAIIENSQTGKKLLLTTGDMLVQKIKQVSMRNIKPEAHDFLIISHNTLRKPTTNYPDVPKAYGDYRASEQGGGFDTLVVNVGELYNIFSYGEMTSLAIYRFCRFMAEKGDPKYLFIMGKGLAGDYLRNYRNGIKDVNGTDFIPTSGFPGSDMFFTVGLRGTTHEPGFPVGRISAKSPLELEAYFEKVKEFESAPKDELWRKNIVHLSGGGNSVEQIFLRGYLNGFKSIAEGELLGGNVVTFSKRTTEPQEIINISEEVNKGQMLVTFFGHSGTGGSDMDIGYVSNEGYGYENKGKYPLLIVNGCLAGDMFNHGYGFGEDWIATPEKGAIGFIAHSNSEDEWGLNRYTSIFYRTAFTDSLFINKGVGDIQKEVAKRYLNGLPLSEKNIAQVQQMVLQGDPSISIFGATLPDFEITADNIFLQSVDGQPINALTEVFNLGLVVRNFGRTYGDSIKITVERVLSNGTKIQLGPLNYKSVYYKDTLYFPIKSEGKDGFGINQFKVVIDPDNDIEELDKSNNTAVAEKFILLGGTNNVYPANYAIVNKVQFKLVAQSMDLLAEGKSFRFELDTTKSFNSSFYRQSTVNASTLAKWEVNLFETLPEQDTVVFYWRTIFTDDTTGIWRNSSFTYVKDGPTGWAMKHFQQFDGTKTINVSADQNIREWDFRTFETSIGVRTFGADHAEYDFKNVELKINDSHYIFTDRLCTDNSMNFVAFDKLNTVPYLGLGKTYILDRRNCGKLPSIVNNMLNSEIVDDLMIEQYIDAIDNGDFVLLFSIGNVTYKSWPASTIAKLAEIGLNSSDISSLSNGEPLIVLGRKGMAPGAAKIVTAVSSDEISLESKLGKATEGTIASPAIGPSSSWHSFFQYATQADDPPTDDYYFDIYGIKSDGQDTLLVSNIKTKEANLSGINHNLIPYLRIVMHLKDEANITPPQLNHWFVTFDGFPEGIISFKEGQEKHGNSAREGEIVIVGFTFENVSELDYGDSIAVKYSVFNNAQGISDPDTMMIKALGAGEAIDFQLDLNTLGKVGENDLEVFANPYIQIEQNFNNNIIGFEDFLSVVGDNSNPIMEVTVDGEFIMDGDIVTPSPMIVLRLKDENEVLLKEDTLGVNIYLNEQGLENSTRINFSSPNVIWTPATAENDFTVEFQPETLADGIYVLKAEAADASGNPSGTEPYSVRFEIVNESQITNFFPYPNPFSTRTHFVFTITGSDIPDEIIIQIMTVNGTIVREITQDEIGPIKIGHNKTEYAWDGRDEFGDQLANGVYLYKVKIFNNGEEMKHRETSADKAFKHGMGKIYLLK